MQNLPCTKRSRNGKTSAAGWLLLAAITLASGRGHALDPERRLWLYDALSAVPEPSALGVRRHQFGAHVLNYAGTLDVGGSALLDLKYLEVAVTASQRIFLGTSPDDVALKAALATQQTSFGAELARFYASPQGVYGRLGIGLFSFVPGGTPYWRISLTLGILPKPELPWDVRLYLTVFASFDRRNDSSLLALESNRFHALTSTTRLIVGGFFTWGQVMRAAVTGEEMLLQFGPAIGIDGGFGRVTLKFPMRIWIDRVPLGTSTGYLSDFDTPAFHASWRYAF